jgi:hypothetical protein
MFCHTGGVSHNNRTCGFRPAFRDDATGTVYLSCFPDGAAAPIHLLDGLPTALWVVDDVTGLGLKIRDTVIAGFVKGHQFYTRDEAARELANP